MSIARAQASAIADGFLDGVGSTREGNDLPVIEEILKEAALDFMATTVKNLESAGAVDRARLSSQLTFKLGRSGAAYILSVGYPEGSEAAKYYDYVNKGVAGTVSGGNSPYKFKNDKPGKAMVLEILQWMRRHANVARSLSRQQKHATSIRERKAISLKAAVDETKSLRGMAYAIATNIKRHGRKATHYFDNATKDAFGSALAEALGVALSAEVRLEIREMKNQLN